MKTKNVISLYITTLLLLVTSCSTLLKNNEGIFGKASQKNAEIGTDIRLTENAQSQANEDKLKHIGALSQGGVQYSLEQIISNVPPQVTVAKEMNERVEALAGKPDFTEVKGIEVIVDQLLSETDKVRKEGEKSLAAKDKEIQSIQNNDKVLDAQREGQIAQAMVQANINAQKADQYQATLSDMDKLGGLGAVWYGLHKLIVNASWILGIGGVLFFVLRILSFSNPLAASIFSIFSTMGAWVIHTVEYIFPKALDTAGFIAKTAYNDAQTALNEVITGVQTAEASGKPVSATTIIASVASSLTPAQQAQITSGSLTPASNAVLTTIAKAPITPTPIVVVAATSTLTPVTGSFVTGSV